MREIPSCLTRQRFWAIFTLLLQTSFLSPARSITRHWTWMIFDPPEYHLLRYQWIVCIEKNFHLIQWQVASIYHVASWEWFTWESWRNEKTLLSWRGEWDTSGVRIRDIEMRFDWLGCVKSAKLRERSRCKKVASTESHWQTIKMVVRTLLLEMRKEKSEWRNQFLLLLR